MPQQQKFADYFVVCGLGLEIIPLQDLGGRQKQIGFRGVKERYVPALLDHWPKEQSKKFGVPPGFEMTVLPGGLEFYERGPYPEDESSLPRSYPIVLTNAEGNKLYVWSLTFRDPVDDDIASTYSIPPNSFVDKCICLISRLPYFKTFRQVLEEIHRMCFSPAGCHKPIWDTVAHVTTSITVPRSPATQVLFNVENSLLCLTAPTSGSTTRFPFTEISFQPLAQCLDEENIIKLFTAVSLERRVVLRASKYELLTSVAEAVCHLKYPFKWMLTYIPVLPVKLLDLLEAPGSFLFGVCTTSLPASAAELITRLDGVILVDLDTNRVMVTGDEVKEEDELPALPEPELSVLRKGLRELLAPDRNLLDKTRTLQGMELDRARHKTRKPWSEFHDTQLRLLFLRFFASILSGYSNFLENTDGETLNGRSITEFNRQAFIKKQRMRAALPRQVSTGSKLQRVRASSMDEDLLDRDLTFLVKLFDTQSWNDFVDNQLGGGSLFDVACEAFNKGVQFNMPPHLHSQTQCQVITVLETGQSTRSSRGRYSYDRFPSLERSPAEDSERAQRLKEVEVALKRGSTSSQAALSNAMMEEALRKSFIDRGMASKKAQEMEAERNALVVDIQFKLFNLWDRFLKSPLEEESSEYETIYAMLESDAEGIAGPGFMECINVKIEQGWDCHLSGPHFETVRELLSVAILRAASRSNFGTVIQALQASARLHKREPMGGLKDYIQRHLGHLPVWQNMRFWENYFAVLMERFVLQETNHSDVVLEQLLVLSTHMGELGLVDSDAWGLLEELANRERISVGKLIRVRGALALTQCSLRYFPMAPHSPQAALWAAKHTGNKGVNPGSVGNPGAGQGQVGAPGNAGENNAGLNQVRNWMGNWMGAGKGAGGAPDIGQRRRGAAEEGGRERLPPGPNRPAGRQGGGVRVLRGHKGPITALHAGTRSELGDLMADGDDVGYFISGSTDCTVKLWDTSVRGSELRASMSEHRAAVRCIGSDSTRVVSGAQDGRVLVHDKATSHLLIELKGHEGAISCLRMGSGLGKGTVLTADHTGLVKMSDIRARSHTNIVARSDCPVLCMDYLDHAYMLATAGTDGSCRVWDVRAGKEKYTLRGHTGWVRTVRMLGDVVLTASDDWTARVWTLNDGHCESVLACHAGPVTAMDYSASAKAIVTGSEDHTVRLWERAEGAVRCVDTIAVHNAPIRALRAGDRWLAVAAQDNSLSLLHRQAGEPGALEGGMGVGGHGQQGGAVSEWQLRRSHNKTPDVIRQVACDVDRGRICTGSRTGLLRVWEPTTQAA